MRTLALLTLLLTTSVLTPVGALADDADRGLTERLHALAPKLDRLVLEKAVQAMQCAVRHGDAPGERLAVIDFSLPSSQRRLWLFDLEQETLLLHDLVAHGENTGYKYSRDFSNVYGSFQSSLGLFRTQESYYGRFGYSLRMDGLEPGINDLARERAIVIHPADFVSPDWIERNGYIGRSQGCPAVRPEVADLVVDSLKDGQYLFAYYPDRDWLSESVFLNCRAPEVRAQLAALSP